MWPFYEHTYFPVLRFNGSASQTSLLFAKWMKLERMTDDGWSEVDGTSLTHLLTSYFDHSIWFKHHLWKPGT